ncbi:MAG: chitobiase/beta-hexosaminidase C-terminal domain-containing protein [Flavobacteriaceae bacterium]
MLSTFYRELLFDLPKPGAVIEEGMLSVRQQFPGLEIHYTRDGTLPEIGDSMYTKPIAVNSSDQLVIRVFDPNGRGSNILKIQSK